MTLLGLGLVVAAACVSNNYLDRGIDRRMQRTKRRALASGSIPLRHAVVYAIFLGLSGVGVLAVYSNWLTAAAAVFGYVAYVVLYGIAKRRSVHGTLVGSISGAVPPLVGYLAVSGRLDLVALWLFLILVAWQMPHFYAIALYRLEDYRAAGIPVLPAVRGAVATKRQSAAYIAAFTAIAPLLAIQGHASVWYAIVVCVLGLAWLAHALSLWRTADAATWGKQVFLSSLGAICVLCAALAVDSLLR